MKDTARLGTWNERLAYLTEVFAPRLALVNFIILIPFSIVYYFYVARGTIPQLPWKLQRTVPLIISIVLVLILISELVRKKSPLKNNLGLVGACICIIMVIAMTVFGIAIRGRTIYLDHIILIINIMHFAILGRTIYLDHIILIINIMHFASPYFICLRGIF